MKNGAKKTGWIIGIVIMSVLTLVAAAANVLIFGLLWS